MKTPTLKLAKTNPAGMQQDFWDFDDGINNDAVMEVVNATIDVFDKVVRKL
jgi:hypothetical protein